MGKYEDYLKHNYKLLKPTYISPKDLKPGMKLEIINVKKTVPEEHNVRDPDPWDVLVHLDGMPKTFCMSPSVFAQIIGYADRMNTDTLYVLSTKKNERRHWVIDLATEPQSSPVDL